MIANNLMCSRTHPHSAQISLCATSNTFQCTFLLEAKDNTWFKKCPSMELIRYRLKKKK